MEAVQAGLFAPLGDGDVPVADVITALERQGYDGLYVLEQDVAITGGEPPAGEGPVRDVAKSVAYLRSLEPALSATCAGRGIDRLDQPPSTEGDPSMRTKLRRALAAAAALTLVAHRLHGRRRRQRRHHVGDPDGDTAASEKTRRHAETTDGDDRRHEADTGGATTTAPAAPGPTRRATPSTSCRARTCTSTSSPTATTACSGPSSRPPSSRPPPTRRRRSTTSARTTTPRRSPRPSRRPSPRARTASPSRSPTPRASPPRPQAVVEAGIPLYTLNSGLNNWQDLGAVTHVGQDEIVAGQGAGERFNELGVTTILCGRQEQTNIALEERCEGLAETFEGEVISEFVGLDADPTEQENQIAALLQAEPGHRRLHGHRARTCRCGPSPPPSRPGVSCRSPASTSRPT